MKASSKVYKKLLLLQMSIITILSYKNNHKSENESDPVTDEENNIDSKGDELWIWIRIFR